MKNRSRDEILSKRNRIKHRLETIGFSVADSYIESYNGDIASNSPLKALADSLKIMADCDIVMFCKGWQNARGCVVENLVANLYGLKVIYERDI